MQETIPLLDRVPAEIPIRGGDIVVFDFDGVLSSPFEDDIYKIPPSDEEKDLLKEASAVFELPCGDMPQQYQRHLLYQCAAYLQGKPIEEGPLLPLAWQIQRRELPWFILTARSGLFATRRLDQFLIRHSLSPTEVFGIGRVDKSLQLRLLSKENQGRRILFFEDSQHHIENLRALDIPSLKIYEVRRVEERPTLPTLRQIAWQTLQKGIDASLRRTAVV